VVDGSLVRTTLICATENFCIILGLVAVLRRITIVDNISDMHKSFEQFTMSNRGSACDEHAKATWTRLPPHIAVYLVCSYAAVCCVTKLSAWLLRGGTRHDTRAAYCVRPMVGVRR